MMTPSNTTSHGLLQWSKPMLIWLTLCCLQLCGVADAAPQRMLLPVQTFSIGAGESARATAYCLDRFSETPKQGASYTGAPTSFGDINVSVPGHGDLPLQRAIDQGFIAVSGTGDFSSLEFHSRVSGGPIKVTAKRNSVVLPHKDDAVEDLQGLPQLGEKASSALNQRDIWHTRQRLASQRLGQLPPQLTSSAYSVPADGILATKAWLAAHSKGSAKKTFLLQRVENQESLYGEPLYILFHPSGQMKLYQGNDSLDAVVQEIQQSGGAARPPTDSTRIVLMGDGEESDFDATRLTLQTAAGDGGGGDIIGPNKPAKFDFDPPPGSIPPGGERVYGGGTWEGLRIAYDKEKNLTSTQPFFKRGVVTVITRTQLLLGRLTAVVRDVTRSQPELASATRAVIIAELRDALQQEVEDAKAEVPSLAAREKKTTRAVFTLDGSPYHQPLADIPSRAPDNLRFADNTHGR